jgi:hypothetical protein
LESDATRIYLTVGATDMQLEEKVVRLEKENRILRELRRLDLIKKYGPGS